VFNINAQGRQVQDEVRISYDKNASSYSERCLLIVYMLTTISLQNAFARQACAASGYAVGSRANAVSMACRCESAAYCTKVNMCSHGHMLALV
jgi:hypothetical protein